MKEREKKDIYVYEFDGKPYFNLTNRCCNACAFCIRNNAEGVRGNRLWLEKEPTAAEALGQLCALEKAGLTYTEAVFCGYGEPTYALDVLLPVAEYLKSRGVRVRLNTNGLGNLINGRNIVPDLKGKIDVVSVSLNEADAQGYYALCKPSFGLAAYDEIWRFAGECARQSIETQMTAVDVLPPEKIAACRKRAEQNGIIFRLRHYIHDNENYR